MNTAKVSVDVLMTDGNTDEFVIEMDSSMLSDPTRIIEGVVIIEVDDNTTVVYPLAAVRRIWVEAIPDGR